ncbi:hypothetical protein ACTFIZ_000789 [Dictyostelium cf. discoideum]
MKIKYLIILIINLIFLNLNVNSQDIIELQVSALSGVDSYLCGTNQACETIDGAFTSYQYMANSYERPPLVLNFSPGTYTSFTSRNLTAFNVTFNSVAQVGYGAATFMSNYSNPMFTIYQTSTTNTNIYFNGIEIGNPSYTRKLIGSFIHIDTTDYQNYQTNIEFNEITIPYGQVADLIYVDDGPIVYSQQNGWSNSYAINLASPTPLISISFTNSQFGNDYYTSSFQNSLVNSPKYPISLTVDSCNFTKIIASQTLFSIGSSQISFSNIQMSDVLVSYKPFFIFENSQITIRDSSFAGTLDNCQFLISFGSFLDFRNNDVAFNQINNFFWSQNYAVLDIEKSFSTITNCTISLVGQQQQQSDQGVIYAINSDISLRLNTISSNVSFIINSDGSNFYGYLLSFQQTYFSQYSYLVCSKNHKSTFRGDETFGSMPDFSKNCDYYEQYEKTVSALTFVFVGVAFVLLCSGIVYCFKFCCEKRKSKKTVDTHIYTPISSGEITPINPNVPIDSSS